MADERTDVEIALAKEGRLLKKLTRLHEEQTLLYQQNIHDTFYEKALEFESASEKLTLNAVFGEHGSESTIKPPKDFDLSLEFLMRNKLSEEDVMFLRERYEKGLSERAIAEQHNLTIGIARGKINKAIKRLRHPSRSIYLRYGLVEATKREVERGRVPAYEEGYQAGYQDCKDEFLMRDQNRKERIEKIRCTLPEDIGNLGLSNHAYGMLRRAGISRTETLLMLTKYQIMEIRGIGRKAADEIFAKAEILGFPLDDNTIKKYE